MSQITALGNSSSDLSGLATDLPTLLGVTTGIAVLAGLICLVLHLFSKTKYPRTRHFADAHNGPPIMFASDTGRFEIFVILAASCRAVFCHVSCEL